MNKINIELMKQVAKKLGLKVVCPEDRSDA